MISALVLGEDTRSFLSVIRSLGEMGIKVDVVCYDKTSPALKSKWINHAWHFNYQAYRIEEWIECVIESINSNHYDLVIPCDERAIYPLISHREKINSQTKLALPNKEVRDNLFDKHLTKKLATECNVRVARGELIYLADNSYEDLSRDFTDKFVIKPTESFNEDKLSSRNKVAIISNRNEYDHYIKHADVKGQQFLVEEYFSGTGEGVSLFACKGKVQFLFAHTRVNEPRSGGGSSYRKAIPVDPGMAQACIAICEKTRYDGVGMFEFKKNYVTDEWILIEVNARFWGSLPLAIHAGIDFPRYYAQYLLGDYTLRDTPSANYNLNAYARSFTSDIYDTRAEMQFLAKNDGQLSSITNTLKRLASFARVITNEKIDSYSKQDPAPFREEFKQLLNATVLDKLHGKFVKENQEHHMLALQRVLYTLEGTGRLVFVCYGNIMRSPLAAAFAKIFISNTHLDFTVDSYGFHQNEKRPSPVECITMAAQLGIDLELHRSKLLLQQDLSDNDIVFIFDQKNQSNIDKYYDIEHVFNLAHFIPPGLGYHEQIDDPYGGGEAAVKHCYHLIIEALKNIFERYLMLKE
ncbi:arsenate reductase/protein-tyrosine-phosphatase family protein [Alteromonas lipolytica]|uniref:protein-tyrosine-phosphatase n=1 Tax=Alteromonas lipolytica TaxID=1856405 RepID=A0A1E8FDQ6_9ALTE|nr:ATP-grasp domain-containing protein [Alteromonas lipolytica]OFI34077.1 hypothetical protein BFC17_21245 [Alteromonas lipolytica]GGF65619.1 hypothetical protein GCM10011338_17470 [Alteromonas lipolytica]